MDWLSPLKEITDFVVPFLEGVPAVRAVLGVLLVMFLPGFAWTLVFFRQLRVLERMVVSFGLSVAVVTLSLFSINLLLGVKITGLNSVLAIIILTIVPVAIYYLIRSVKGK
ncbi:hypothetical protein ACFLYX_02095 [Chloroflexota bacterium]